MTPEQLAPGDDLVERLEWHSAFIGTSPWSDGYPQLSEVGNYLAQAAARIAALTATVAELEREIPRFPDHMAQIVAAKNERLPERLQTLIAAIEAIPEYMRQYQWQADAKQAFGSKWVRAIAGDNGKGAGRQAIAEVVGHIDVADYIAAANPDTVSMLIAENATLRDRLARMEGAMDDEAAQEVDRLRLQAFATNLEADRMAYFKACSKWFQNRHTAALTDGGTE